MTVIGCNVNLMVADVARTVRFYTDLFELEVAMSVDADQQTTFDDSALDDAVFATVRVGDGDLMIQGRESMIDDAGDAFDSTTTIGGTAALYVRVDDLDAVVARLDPDRIVKPVGTTWYGMREVWFRDPDGYVVTAGAPDGEPPSP